ncbi:MAG: gluconate 2-dehydrogenase subunit 3 family protein [Gammaproteobacteria bacterium]|nr:gluconate 2-dehydrogenase subunit 3 family protein [Gammaproteobacteria bacterium]
MKRRGFFQRLAGLLLLGVFSQSLKGRSFPATLTIREQAVLRRYFDRLIPFDGTPGALETGVAEAVFAQAETNRQYRRLLKKGGRWLNYRAKKTAGIDFLSLDDEQADKVIAHAEKTVRNAFPRRFFQRTRHDAMTHHYADSRSWRGLAYAGPPQPHGFPDYQQPPAQAPS